MVNTVTPDWDNRSIGEPAPCGRPKDNAPALRICLSCRGYFKSAGWGNRLCQTCRSRSSASMAA